MQEEEEEEEEKEKHLILLILYHRSFILQTLGFGIFGAMMWKEGLAKDCGWDAYCKFAETALLQPPKTLV